MKIHWRRECQPSRRISVGKESAYNAEDPGSISWVGKFPWRRDRLPTPVLLGLPCGSARKECTCNVGDLGSIPGLGRSPGEGKGYPLQCSGLENSMGCVAYAVAKSLTRLSGFHSFSHSPVFLSGEFHRHRRLASYSPWGGKELATLTG